MRKTVKNIFFYHYNYYSLILKSYLPELMFLSEVMKQNHDKFRFTNILFLFLVNITDELVAVFHFAAVI